MKQLFLVGIAGLCGALLRTAIGLWMGEGYSFPIATFLVNMAATWLLCLIATGVAGRIFRNKQLEEMITVGFLGSFSTFSAFSIETVLLFESGAVFTAMIYVVASVLGGIGIGLFGCWCGRKWQEK